VIINTGLLLRRPYESEYVGIRRFLVANQSETPAALKTDLQAFGKSSAVVPEQPWLAPRARQWEQKFCEASQPWPQPSELLKRNCPCCSAHLLLTYLAENIGSKDSMDTRFFEEVRAISQQYDVQV
jgi:hypothetical protein